MAEAGAFVKRKNRGNLRKRPAETSTQELEGEVPCKINIFAEDAQHALFKCVKRSYLWPQQRPYVDAGH